MLLAFRKRKKKLWGCEAENGDFISSDLNSWVRNEMEEFDIYGQWWNWIELYHAQNETWLNDFICYYFDVLCVGFTELSMTLAYGKDFPLEINSHAFYWPQSFIILFRRTQH
jgi:hypothetical protein